MVVSVSESVVAGAVSGSVTRLLTAPLDVLKIRFQLQIEPIHKLPHISAVCFEKWFLHSRPHSAVVPVQLAIFDVMYSFQESSLSKYRGLVDASQKILREEGITAFWKGLIPGQVLYIAYGATQFTAFEVYKNVVNPKKTDGLWRTSSMNFTAGSLAGATATVACHPFDTIRTRFIGQGKPKIYRSLPHAIGMMYTENGLRTFYKGLTPALLAIAPQAGLYFGTYHTFTAWWNIAVPRQLVGGIQWILCNNGLAVQISEMAISLAPRHFDIWSNRNMRSSLCGALAGVVSKTLMLPLDLVKKRLEIQGFEKARSTFGRLQHYNGFIHCFVSIVKQEGVLAFYKGAFPALIKAGTSIALSFLIYEETLRLLQQDQVNR